MADDLKDFIDFIETSTRLIAGGIFISGTLAGTYIYGPVDLGRTVYNQFTGDIPVLKRDLTNKLREGIKEKNPNYSSEEVEVELRIALDIPSNEEFNPNHVSTAKLWDANELYHRDSKENWLWLSLDTKEKRKDGPLVPENYRIR